MNKYQQKNCEAEFLQVESASKVGGSALKKYPRVYRDPMHCRTKGWCNPGGVQGGRVSKKQELLQINNCAE